MMQYRITRNDIRPSYPGKPFGWVPDDMKDKTETRQVFSSGRMQDMVFWKVGEVFDNEWGPLAVLQGFAVPVDDECKAACGRSPEQILAAQKGYERTQLGIHPDDFEAYEKGWMQGYYADGSWKPGPKHAEYVAIQAQEEDEDE